MERWRDEETKKGDEKAASRIESCTADFNDHEDEDEDENDDDGDGDDDGDDDGDGRCRCRWKMRREGGKGGREERGRSPESEVSCPGKWPDRRSGRKRMRMIGELK
ncbi:hypothetical protein TWF481_010581 [Arthrobotrys musiformis]|uniref:Uncharacterized protein n=1 Tax=Arthrobotrys musiformis TaxID=47236 RepID=A0AAV9W756_9PEZI